MAKTAFGKQLALLGHDSNDNSVLEFYNKSRNQTMTLSNIPDGLGTISLLDGEGKSAVLIIGSKNESGRVIESDGCGGVG